MNLPTSSARSVCVILPTYNRADLLAKALDSLLSQTRRPNRILVVDDGSTDHTPQLLDAYRGRIDVIRTSNRGKPAAVNTALEAAKSDFIWIFDDDDVALPEALALHIAYLDAHPDIDFTYSDKYIFEGNGDIWQEDQWRISRLPDIAPEDFLLRTMYSMNTLFQGMLVPARCYEQTGPFDETLHRCEDHEMLLRLSARFRAGGVGQPTFVYREHAGVRGAGAHSHDAEARFRVMLDYRQRIFRDVREQYSLSCYLRLRDVDKTQSPQGGAKALAVLERGCVMLRHGLVAEALADFDTALSHRDKTISPYAERMHDALSLAVDVEPWIVPNYPQLLRSLSQLLRRHGRGGFGKYLARGLYWRTRRSFNNKAYREGLNAMRMLGLFCSFWVWDFGLPRRQC
ncbi:MAG: glycosyltransferase [Salinisphaera sp.]|jgi:GT2 family glycosyltransferase|nr:glycosyltransferase [Salinisphaera sp.]